MSYAALWCKSNCSFLEGASHPEELVEEARRLGLSALALTDRDGVYGIVRAHEKAREFGLHLIIGSEITVAGADGADGTIVLLVEDRAGYASLCQLITQGRLRSEKGASRVSWREVCEHAGGLFALWRGPLGPSGAAGDATRSLVLDDLKDAFGGRLYALAARHLVPEEVAAEAELRARCKAYGIPLVAGNEVLYHAPARKKLQDIVTCIRHGVTLYGAGRLIKPNAENDLKSPHAFAKLYADDAALVARTVELAGRCRFSLGELRYRYPSEQLPDGKTSADWLRELSFAGARRRYPNGVPAEVSAQIEKELHLINQLDYCGYFLTMYEIVEFCRRRNILCQGRGSAANSAVCFCLGVTAVDPTRVSLLFERFLSVERAEPPDIDLDIEHQRREEVIQHVYEKYGRARAAMVANVVRYRERSAIRDVGKALGIAETELDRMVKAGDSGRHPHLLERANEILDFPRHLSIHPGGFLLGHEPIATLVPMENATMEGRTVIQWDKNDVESIGLFKVDLLGLGALTLLHLCFDLMKKHRGLDMEMADIPEGDAATYEAIQRADTVGIFQIESRAQMSMLPRLKPKNYYDLVIEVSIVRPGPITGGMVHPYLRRRNKLEEIEYPHPSLIPVLQKTLGVPLFQEQVMQLAIVAADYTPGEADQLRRDMAGWRRTGGIEQHREKLISRMQTKGISFEFAEKVFKQICGFGEYGFPESHAASFALISYAHSYLKRHFPSEFTCALLNAQPMGFYAPGTIVEDAKRHGVEIRPADITKSQWDCTLEPIENGPNENGFAIRMGLRYVKGLGEAAYQRIAAAAPFSSVEDLVRRTRLDEGALSALAEADVFCGLALERRQALWQTYAFARAHALPLPVENEPVVAFAPLTPLEAINWDYRRLGMSARGHPLGPMRAELQTRGLPDARTVAEMRHGQRVRYAGLVICRQHPGTASGVTFYTLEDETGLVNLVVWKRVFDAYSTLARTQSFLGVSGTIQTESGVTHIVVDEMWRPELARAPAKLPSRDFR